MYRVTFVSDLFGSRRDPAESIEVLQVLLDTLTSIDLLYLARHRVPHLYTAGVRYERETGGRENWQEIATTLRLRRGDCEDLGCWRAAELQHAGIKARAFPRAKRRDDGSTLYHILVRHPDGRIEDPSRQLGMR